MSKRSSAIEAFLAGTDWATAQRVRIAGDASNRSYDRLTNPNGDQVPLSGGEFELLEVFVSKPGRVLNRDQLLDMARGREAQPFDRAIDVQVSRLRKKIEPDPKTPTLIKTVRGGGYMFTPKVTKGST